MNKLKFHNYLFVYTVVFVKQLVYLSRHPCVIDFIRLPTNSKLKIDMLIEAPFIVKFYNCSLDTAFFVLNSVPLRLKFGELLDV